MRNVQVIKFNNSDNTNTYHEVPVHQGLNVYSGMFLFWNNVSYHYHDNARISLSCIQYPCPLIEASNLNILAPRHKESTLKWHQAIAWANSDLMSIKSLGILYTAV